MKKVLVGVMACAVVAGSSQEARGQEAGKAGLTIHAPGTIGVMLRLGESVAVRRDAVGRRLDSI